MAAITTAKDLKISKNSIWGIELSVSPYRIKMWNWNASKVGKYG